MPASIVARSVVPAGFGVIGQELAKMHPALAADLLQPLQFGERIGVIVDAQVEIGPLLLAMDHQRRRLLAALVAAGRFARAHRRDQPAREGDTRCSSCSVSAVASITCGPASMLPATEKPLA